MTETQPHARAAVPGSLTHRATTGAGLRERVLWMLMRWAGPAIPVIILAAMGYRRRWVTEDAFISLRVVEQILAGNGPVFNQGERVEAYTHPLWVAILAGWGALGLPTPLGSVILGFSCSLLGLVAALSAASRLSERLTLVSAGAYRSPRVGATAAASPCLTPARLGEGEAAAIAPTRGEHNDPPGADLSPPTSDLAVPVGALIFVSLPVVWDFVTSGLETGLAFAWLGVSFWLLVRTCFDARHIVRLSATTIGTAIVIGLGPLVRPDLAIFSVGFLVSLIVCSIQRTRFTTLRRALQLCVAAASLPLAYQIFRMGYFAALVPNTAHAKEASDAQWSQGWLYLRDFTGTYQLWLPLLIAAGCWGLSAQRAWRNADRAALVLMSAPVISALLHAAYVVRVGGDFMHGRFLLPTLFGLLLPVMLVRVPLTFRPSLRTAIVSAGLLVLVGWSIVAALWLRVPYLEHINDDGLADERGVFTANAGHPNPIDLDDYMRMGQSWPRDGLAWHDRASNGPRVLIIEGDKYPLALLVNPRIAVVAFAWNVGLAGYAAGVDVHVTDRYGLADPIASRLRLEERGRPGHEKQLDPVWAIARFSTAGGSVENQNELAAARAALDCGDIAELLEAVEEPLTVGRFVDNLFLAWSQHDLRIPNDPETAVAEHC